VAQSWLTSRLTVAIAISDPELAERVREILTADPGFDVVAADDGHTPDVLVADSAGELADETVEGAPVVMLGDASTAVEALRSGAAAVLLPDAGAGALRAAIRAAALGLTTLPAELRPALLEQAGRHRLEGEDNAPAAGLTARELQVLQLLAEGASNKAIARRLGITPHTAKFHVAAIAGKLGASGRTDAVAKAMRLGLVMV
jgi:DNA-binding NarL/FixJ family response regulator